MPKQSAGILLFRRKNGKAEFFLVHPGGPFWAKKDDGAWSIPKGEFDDGEDALTVAIREFEEETGVKLRGEFKPLAPIKQKGGKTVYSWFVEGNVDETKIVSNTFEMEWPPKSGVKKTFPEVDRAGWFLPETAVQKINEKQAGILRELILLLES